MKLNNDKTKALLIIGLAILLHSISWKLITNTYGYKTSHTYEGNGLIVGMVGLFAWIYGFIKYARAKGRSELLAFLLSLFWIPGLVVLLLLPDSKK